MPLKLTQVVAVCGASLLAVVPSAGAIEEPALGYSEEMAEQPMLQLEAEPAGVAGPTDETMSEEGPAGVPGWELTEEGPAATVPDDPQ